MRSNVISKAFALLAVSGSLFACSGLLGLTDPDLDPDYADPQEDGGNVFADGGPDEDVTTDADGGPLGCDGVDTTSNPDNCGQCGHSCLGGDCQDSNCEPVLVVDNAATLSPYDIVEGDGGTLFFTNVNTSVGIASLAKIDKNAVKNSSAAQIIGQWSGKAGSPFQVAAAAGKVWFATYSGSATDGFYEGGIVQCTTTTCPTKPTVAGIDSYAVTNSGANVFYSVTYENDAGDDTYNVRTQGLDLTTGAVTQSGVVPMEINYLKVSGSTLFIAADDGIYTCSAVSCTDPKHVGNDIEADELAIANDHVYYTSDDTTVGPSVQVVGVAGGGSVQITNKVTVPLGIAADATYVYFADIGDNTNPADGKVVRCPIAGCGAGDADAVLLSRGAASGGNPRGIYDDGRAIYWGTRSGKIWKIAK